MIYAPDATDDIDYIVCINGDAVCLLMSIMLSCHSLEMRQHQTHATNDIHRTATV